MKGHILVTVVNGARAPLDHGVELLVTAIDGRERPVVRGSVKVTSAQPIRLENLEVRDNLDDRYTVLLAARDHVDAGFTPVRVEAGKTQHLHLMMLRRGASFRFTDFDAIEASQPLCAFLGDKHHGDRDAALARFEQLRAESEPALACLLNITAALQQMTLVPHEDLDTNPFLSFKALESAHQDRIFAWVDKRLVSQLAETSRQNGNGGVSRIVTAPKGMHEGATVSYKQTDFGEGNVQFSFHDKVENIRGVDCVKVDVDIDYYKDTAAHLLLEVFPNTLKSKIYGKHASTALTDPRKVYGIRWIAGERFGRPFKPLFTLS
ncbi:MAG TPA: hypothetical protein VFO48_02060 [Vicinamibacterales bacterium]|nr:hypothetical protein [Vicinamibacterales bacterium]